MAGKPVHIEIAAGDTGRAKEFWSRLFGWQWESYPGPFEYHMTRIDETAGAAIYAAEGDQRGLRPYFDVDDINAGAARVRELGGDAGDALPVPQMGWFAQCKDTEGNEFGLLQTDPAAPAPEA